MADTIIEVNLSESPHTNENVHNRWHSDIPIGVRVEPGNDFKIETYDRTGGQIANNDAAADVRDVELEQVHYLSGPIGVKGAKPGDLLVVEILDIGAKEESQRGFNGFFSKQNGGGFLTEHFPLAQKSIWDFHGMFTTSRHVPPREHGGNCNIKDLSRGSKIYFPVYVDGTGLSMGDLHFSQGDGEITFCGAIEMASWLHLKVELIKDGMSKYGVKNPIFKPSPITPKYDDYLIFEGISVDESGTQHYLDVHIAYRQACLNAIEYL